jgi:hypothetical protein
MSQFAVKRYELDTQLCIDAGEMSGRATISLVNSSQTSAASVSLLLNKGMHVTSIQDNKKKRLDFRQNFKSFSDLTNVKVNHVQVRFDKIKPHGKYIIRVAFKGAVVGYEDVFRYTKDHIGTEFSLVRPDVFAYPLIGSLCFRRFIRDLASQSFDYELNVTAPRGYVAASGGRLQSKIKHGGNVTYRFVNRVPTYRIDAAVAKFKVVTRRRGDLRFYVFPEDLPKARQLQKQLERTWKFFEDWFMLSPRTSGYTVIEIPKGWGSQAGADYMLLDEDSIKDETKISALYHELAHLWNVQSAERYPSRFFDEGFASYFQALAEQRLLGDDAFRRRMESLRKRFSDLCNEDKRYGEVPMSRYGELGLGDASYSKGAWALYVLHVLLGEAEFKRSIRAFVKRHLMRPAGIDDLRSQLEKTLQKKLAVFFDEWFFGAKSSEYLNKATNIDDIAAKYR